MRPLLITAGAALFSCALAGWLASGGGGGVTGAAQVSWSPQEPPELGAEQQKKIFSALIATGHFGVPRESEIDESEGEDESDVSLLQIAGAWIIGDEIAVSFYSAEQGLVAAGVGDSLPGGWVVMDATLERVIIERNGDARELVVFPYDRTGT